MGLLDNQGRFQRDADMMTGDNLTAVAHLGSQSISVGTDLPLPAIISGALVLALLVAVLVGMIIYSHQSPRHATFSVRHHQHELDSGLQAEEQVTVSGYSSDNNAFDQTVDKSFFTSRSYATYNREKSRNSAACSRALTELPDTADNGPRASWTRRQSASWNRAYKEDCHSGSHVDQDGSQADNRGTWLMASTHPLDVIPEESDGMLSETSLSKNCDSSPDYQVTLNACQDSDNGSGTQFHSCSEGEEVSDTEVKISSQITSLYDQIHRDLQHENFDQDEEQETSQLICMEISRGCSGLNPVNTTVACDSINEESSLLTVHSAFQSSLNEANSLRSLEAPSKPPRKSLPKS